MIQYIFDESHLAPIKNKRIADPQRIGEALEEVKRKNNGHLRPADAVRDAKDPRNPLHPHLEWDDGKAGAAHRRHQMRGIIASIVAIDLSGSKPRETPAFVSIRSSEDGTSYRSTRDVLRSKGLTKLLLKQAKDELLAFQRRYDRYELLTKAVQKPLEVIDQLIAKEDDDPE